MENSDKILAIDIGGTRIKYTLMKRDFSFSEVAILHHQVHNLKDNLRKIVASYFKQILGIAISVTGAVDTKLKRIVFVTENKLAWKDFDFNFLAEEFNLPLLVENDANAAAFSEFIKNPHLTKYALVVFGTGVGAGFVFDHKMQSTPLSGEVGHSYLGKKLVDTSLSIKVLHLSLEKDFQVKLFEPDFYQKVYLKNDLVKEKMDQYLDDIANLFYNLAVYLEFSHFFIGGSLSSLDRRFLDKIRDFYQNYRKQSPYQAQIEFASFKNNSELLGVAYKFFALQKQAL